jgi:hypothetical protein
MSLLLRGTTSRANRGVYRDVLRYVGQAKRTTRAVAWALRDLSSVRDQERSILSVVTGQLRAQHEVFSISVGDASGSLITVGRTFDDPKYGVNRAKALPPEIEYRIHRADLVASPQTEFYEYLNADMKVIERETVPVDSVKTDARTRRWYRTGGVLRTWQVPVQQGARNW